MGHLAFTVILSLLFIPLLTAQPSFTCVPFKPGETRTAREYSRPARSDLFISRVEIQLLDVGRDSATFVWGARLDNFGSSRQAPFLILQLMTCSKAVVVSELYGPWILGPGGHKNLTGIKTVEAAAVSKIERFSLGVGTP